MAGPDVLRLEGVGRAFPQDVGESAAAIWREMLLSRAWLPRGGAHGLHVLAGVDLAVPAGRCVGVLGGHRSGKSTLAAIAAGVLAPTAGRVLRPRRCVLVARPAAGFKPGLTVRENLRLLGLLHGLAGDPLARLLDEVLACCGVGAAEADAATGNLSPQQVRPLALALLLGLPADLLVVDAVSAAGAGGLREALHARLHQRLSSGASLVLSADAFFLREVAACVHRLERGRLVGPLATGPVPGLSRPRRPASPAGQGLPPARPWQLLRVTVDGQPFRHAQASLLRRPGERMRVELDLRATGCQRYAGGRFELHGGRSGLPLGRWDAPAAEVPVQAGQRARLRFELCVPDAGEDFFGLSFTPAGRGPGDPPGHRLKVLIYGVGRRPARATPPRLDITCLSFEPERNAPHAPPPAAKTVAGLVAGPVAHPLAGAPPSQGQPAARQVG